MLVRDLYASRDLERHVPERLAGGRGCLGPEGRWAKGQGRRHGGTSLAVVLVIFPHESSPDSPQVQGAASCNKRSATRGLDFGPE
jgi:hypothetical protein